MFRNALEPHCGPIQLVLKLILDTLVSTHTRSSSSYQICDPGPQNQSQGYIFFLLMHLKAE